MNESHGLPQRTDANLPSVVANDQLDRILAVQIKETEVRAQEVALRSQQDTNGFEFAKVALAAQKQDREADRQHTRKLVKGAILGGAILVIALVGFLGFALYSGHEKIVEEIIKILGYGFTGGFGGYGIAKSRSRKSEEKDL